MTEEELDALEKEVLLAQEESAKKIDNLVRQKRLAIKLEVSTNPEIQAAIAASRLVEELGVKIDTLVSSGIKRSYYTAFNYVTQQVMSIAQMIVFAGANTAIAEAITGIKHHTACELVDSMPKMPYYSPQEDRIVNEDLVELNVTSIAMLLPQIWAVLGQDLSTIDPKVYNIVEIEKLHNNELKKAIRKMEATHKEIAIEAKLDVELDPSDLV